MTSIEPTTSLTLNQRRDRIIAHVENAAIEVGRELLAAKRDHPGVFTEWLSTQLPISPAKAYSLMAIADRLDALPPEDRALLPQGWTVLLEISKLPSDQLHVALSSGQITPQVTKPEVIEIRQEAIRAAMKMKEATPPRDTGVRRPGVGGIRKTTNRLSADMVARELIRRPREDLTAPIEKLLREWLGPEGDSDGLDRQGKLSGR